MPAAYIAHNRTVSWRMAYTPITALGGTAFLSLARCRRQVLSLRRIARHERERDPELPSGLGPAAGS